MPNAGETAGGPAPHWMTGQSKARHKEPSQLMSQPCVADKQLLVSPGGVEEQTVLVLAFRSPCLIP